jgi:hypothetical protein
MSPMKSPGALAARGASETDQLGRQVTPETNRQQSLTQAPILATLAGADLCSGEGIAARGHAPVLDLCRALVEAGHDPKRALHAMRRGVLALTVRSIGEGAELTVADDRHGTPRLRRRQERHQRYAAGSLIAPNPRRQGAATLLQQVTQEAVP